MHSEYSNIETVYRGAKRGTGMSNSIEHFNALGCQPQ